MAGVQSRAAGAETENVPEAAVHLVATEREAEMRDEEVMLAPVRINRIATGKILFLKILSSLLPMRPIHVLGFPACQRTLPSER